MGIRRRDEEEKKEEKREEDKKKTGVDNKLELLKYTSEVQSRIKKEITSDLVLCKLGEQDKIGVTEMTVNAYLAARQIRNIGNKAKKYEFNKEEQTWYERALDEKEEEVIRLTEEKVFDTFMTKVNMCAILNRNVDRNNMIEVLAGIRREELEEEDRQRKEDGIVKKLISKTKKKETDEEAERRTRGER